MLGSTAARLAGPISHRVQCQDTAKGEGFIMHSMRSLRERGFGLAPDSNDYFVCVRWHLDDWMYDSNHEYRYFYQTRSDTLVAGVNFATGEVSSLENSAATSYEGIRHGYSYGDLNITAHHDGTGHNWGEYVVAGTYLKLGDTQQDLGRVSSC